MPHQPAGRDLHVDTPLTNVSIGYKNANYISDEICPIVLVKKQSGIVPKYDQSHWFRNEAKLRAPGTRSQGGGFSVDITSKYFCDTFSTRKEIWDGDRDNVDQPFDMDRDATNFVTDKCQMTRELKCATDFFTTGVWGVDNVGATDFVKWSDYGGSSPIIDLDGGKDSVDGKIAQEPNTIVFGKQVWNKLKWHPDLIDLIKYTQKAQVSTELFGSLLEFMKVLVGRAIYTASPEGTAEGSVTYSRIWGKHALALFVPDRPSLMTPAAMYTFVWERVAGAIQYIKSMRDEERETDIIEANTNFDQKQTAANAGIFWSNAVA